MLDAERNGIVWMSCRIWWLPIEFTKLHSPKINECDQNIYFETFHLPLAPTFCTTYCLGITESSDNTALLNTSQAPTKYAILKFSTSFRKKYTHWSKVFSPHVTHLWNAEIIVLQGNFIHQNISLWTVFQQVFLCHSRIGTQSSHRRCGLRQTHLWISIQPPFSSLVRRLSSVPFRKCTHFHHSATQFTQFWVTIHIHIRFHFHNLEYQQHQHHGTLQQHQRHQNGCQPLGWQEEAIAAANERCTANHDWEVLRRQEILRRTKHLGRHTCVGHVVSVRGNGEF